MSTPDSKARGRAAEAGELAGEVLRRLFYTGAGALFATEEGVRKIAGDLPKDAANFLVTQAQHTKDEALRVVAIELRRFLDKVDLQEVVRKVLANVVLEVKAEIRFVPAESGIKIEGKPKVALKRRASDQEAK